MTQSGITFWVSIQLIDESCQLPNPNPNTGSLFLTLGNITRLCKHFKSALCFDPHPSEILESFLLTCSSLCFCFEILLFSKSIKKWWYLIIQGIREPVCCAPLKPSSLKHSPGLFSGCCSFAQSCLTLCNPMDRSTPGFPVPHCLLEFAQTHIHRVEDAIKPFHPLSLTLLFHPHQEAP